jgi:penicillin-binding protein 1A
MARLAAHEDRVNVPLDAVPDIVVKAVIAMEDRDFYQHDGINPAGIARAFYQDARARGAAQGGSTITQQYVKNAFDLSREKAITRKIREAFLSIKLEQQMSKDRILEGYLNTIYFGRGAYGVAAASRAYFNKDVGKLGIGEAALLAGLIRGPALAEPTKHPEEATRRRHTALVAMREEGYIKAGELTLYDAVPMKAPFVLPYSSIKQVENLRGASGPGYIGTDYLQPYIKRELQAIDKVRFSDEAIARDGFRVYTSINYDTQRAAWQAVTSTLNREDDPKTPEYEGDPEASLVAIDDQGLVRAMVGGRHRYHATKHAVNYAVRSDGNGGFQPGSTFKPLVLAEALREGYSLRSRFRAPGHIEFPGLGDDGAPWKVSNYSDTGREGVMDLVNATSASSNTAFAGLMVSLGTDYVPFADGKSVREGPKKVAELAQSMGIGGAAGIPVRDIQPAMALGSAVTTPLEMAGAYSTFANRGVYKQPSIITRVEQVDQEGRTTVLYERKVNQKRILSEGTADLVNYALQGVVKDGGTGHNANLGKPAAGKTGTAQNNTSSWFTGFVPKLTASVWMGYPNAGDGSGWDDPETPEKEDLIWPMNSNGRLVHGIAVTGGSLPAEIWRKFMTAATGDSQDQFIEPTDKQINSGEVLNQGELLTPDEAARTTLLPPIVTIPTTPTTPGGPGNTKPTRPDPSTTLPGTDPSTTSSSPSITSPGDGGPGFPPGQG